MDEHAFALLIEPHRKALHLHCYRMLGSLHDADVMHADQDHVAAIFGFPDPWLFEQLELPAALS